MVGTTVKQDIYKSIARKLPVCESAGHTEKIHWVPDEGSKSTIGDTYKEIGFEMDQMLRVTKVNGYLDTKLTKMKCQLHSVDGVEVSADIMDDNYWMTVLKDAYQKAEDVMANQGGGDDDAESEEIEEDDEDDGDDPYDDEYGDGKDDMDAGPTEADLYNRYNHPEDNKPAVKLIFYYMRTFTDVAKEYKKVLKLFKTDLKVIKSAWGAIEKNRKQAEDRGSSPLKFEKILKAITAKPWKYKRDKKDEPFGSSLKIFEGHKDNPDELERTIPEIEQHIAMLDSKVKRAQEKVPKEVYVGKIETGFPKDMDGKVTFEWLDELAD